MDITRPGSRACPQPIQKALMLSRDFPVKKIKFSSAPMPSLHQLRTINHLNGCRLQVQRNTPLGALKCRA